MVWKRKLDGAWLGTFRFGIDGKVEAIESGGKTLRREAEKKTTG